MEIDPVCGMDVDPKTAIYKSEYLGKMYYFCSPGCKRDFDKEPHMFVSTTAQSKDHDPQHSHSA